LPASAVVTLAVIVAGCGGSSSSSSTTTAANVAPAANTSTAKAKTQPAHTIRLRIVSPRPGAHTGQTLTVHVKLTGASAHSARFRYVLGSVKRSAGSKITFHGVAPGRHDLTVTLASNQHIRASEVVTVHAPAATPAPTPTTQAVAPTTSSPTPAPAPAPPPTTTKSTPPPAPPTTTKTTPPPSGIPQNGGGDADGDNNGGPSDGDGNI
jgi:hypothetical protein